MKKIFNLITLFAALSATLLTGCKKEELVFDHEKPQFEIVNDAILLEMIMPTGTAADEQLYITGEFNGGEKYLLEKAQYSDKKWGIYLYETDFAEGKTLADGFYFVSEKNGKEYSAKGEAVVHTLNAAYGTRTNVWVESWEAFFQTGDKPVTGEYEHLYIIGNVEGAGWKPAEQLEFTMVGTDIFRGEFTFVPDGTNTICYFAITTAMGADNDDWATVNAARWGNDNAELTEGNVVDLKLQDGGDQNVTIAPGTYTITVNMVTKQIVIGEGNWSEPEKPGKYEHLYILGNVEGAGWNPDAPLEMQKVGRDLFRGEFTFVPDGTNTVCYFCFATDFGDWDIVNANRWGNENKLIEEEMYVPLVCKGEQNLTIAPGTYTITVNMIFKEAVIGEGDWSGRQEPDDEEEKKDDDPVVSDSVTTHFYFIDETTDMHYVYTYGGGVNLFGGWPGADWTAWQTATFLGQKLYCYEFTELRGLEVNGILNNNNDDQIEPAFKFEVGDQLDYFFRIGDEAVTEEKPTPDQADAIRRMFHK